MLLKRIYQKSPGWDPQYNHAGVDCVLSGCAVTGGADMTPAVAKGAVLSNKVLFPVTAADVAVYAAGVNQAFVRRVVIRFAASASGSYCFFERDQAGAVFNGGYTPAGGACVQIVEQAAGVN